MVAESVIPPQKRKSFHLVLLKHLNVDLKIEPFVLQSIWFYFLLKFTDSFLELYTVKSRSLFYVFFRGYVTEVESQACYW